MAWHLKGAAGTWPEYQELTRFDRACIAHFLNDRIERHNGDFEV